jgi:hypothetical protein
LLVSFDQSLLELLAGFSARLPLGLQMFFRQSEVPVRLLRFSFMLGPT